MTQISPSRFHKFPAETEIVANLTKTAALSAHDRARISDNAAALVDGIRNAGNPGMMEVFLAEYGFSTEEGIALMCLAEALLRVPDAETIDALIEDKIAPSDWGKHLGHSSSSLVNASTWALLLTGRVLDDTGPGLAGALRLAVKRLGEPVIRVAAKKAMREMGQQFVLGETMQAATSRATKLEEDGYTYSYDMLGEAAMTEDDAARYFASYANAIKIAGGVQVGKSVADRPGVSVKLSALHPRYEVAKHKRVIEELVPRLRDLARMAAKRNIGLNIDAEEADRLEISLDIIGAVLADEKLAGWDGFGIVVQAYGLRAAPVIDHLFELAKNLDRRIMVRLVKGAYWDTEIKLAQVEGLQRFPVFTTKPATDVSYLACARKLLAMTDRIYPQFATHNAHTVAAVLDMARDPSTFEFQRLHGMGEQLHELVKNQNNTRCRIYAPVGAHRDLLAYLVRRLLENGANSSFVNQVVDEDIPPHIVTADPFDALGAPSGIPASRDLYQPQRINSRGWDLTDGATLAEIDAARAPFLTNLFKAVPLVAGETTSTEPIEIRNPAKPDDIVGQVSLASAADASIALTNALPWDASGAERVVVLNRAAELYEANAGELFALLAREAGKTHMDAVAELREAVDFFRYYAAMGAELGGLPIGIVACISPWNFPLAIFTGQIAGALSAGCSVLAKPAEQTPLVAYRAVQLLHEAGVPLEVLQYLPGDGATVGRALTSDPRVGGVAFTGSTETAKLIRKAMAANMDPGAPLVAETGGINAMIVDSTALLEQAVRDVVASAFQSAGQRCSALRCLYVQEDIAEAFCEMLFGAMDELKVGDPWNLDTDVGPLIDAEANDDIAQYLTDHGFAKQLRTPIKGYFCAPAVVEVEGILSIPQEVFGPVLHIATFSSDELDQVITDINSTGYGLTFGLHTRIDSRVQEVVEKIETGNTYVNRNQIGAVVGTQPFGGEGLSGTGPKAGGPFYAARFQTNAVTDRTRQREMPGPTGETNQLTLHTRPPFLCLGPGDDVVSQQLAAVRAAGGIGQNAEGITPDELRSFGDIGGALWWGDESDARKLAEAMADRDGAILPLITGKPRAFEVLHERHLCVDTTASGGNAALLA